MRLVESSCCGDSQGGSALACEDGESSACERAAYFQDLAETEARLLSRPEILGVELNLGVAALDAEDWATVTCSPYGTADIRPGEHPMAIVAATTDNALVNSFRANQQRAPSETLLRLAELGMSYRDAAVMQADLVALRYDRQ